jgi:hypothetical protein
MAGIQTHTPPSSCRRLLLAKVRSHVYGIRVSASPSLTYFSNECLKRFSPRKGLVFSVGAISAYVRVCPLGTKTQSQSQSKLREPLGALAIVPFCLRITCRICLPSVYANETWISALSSPSFSTILHTRVPTTFQKTLVIGPGSPLRAPRRIGFGAGRSLRSGQADLRQSLKQIPVQTTTYSGRERAWHQDAAVRVGSVV